MWSVRQFRIPNLRCSKTLKIYMVFWGSFRYTLSQLHTWGQLHKVWNIVTLEDINLSQKRKRLTRKWRKIVKLSNARNSELFVSVTPFRKCIRYDIMCLSMQRASEFLLYYERYRNSNPDIEGFLVWSNLWGV